MFKERKDVQLHKYEEHVKHGPLWNRTIEKTPHYSFWTGGKRRSFCAVLTGLSLKR